MIDQNILHFTIDGGQEQLPFIGKARDSLEFIYYCQVYSLEMGGDVAIWWRTRNGDCNRFVYSTGPLVIDVPSAVKERIHNSNASNAESISQAVNDAFSQSDLPSNDIVNALAGVNPRINHHETLNGTIFNKLLKTASKLRPTNDLSDWTNAAICNTSARIVLRYKDTTSDICSWGPSNKPEEYWKVVKKLINKTGIT
jgi:hypothetical protein